MDAQLGTPIDVVERGLFSLAELAPRSIDAMVRRSCSLLKDRSAHDRPLSNKLVGLLFTKTSTRTRTAFTTAALRMGGQVIAYNGAELQLATGESLEDTARVFGRMLDLMVIRTAGPVDDMLTISRTGAITVINAMSAEEHPTQGVCDIATILSHFGSVDGIKGLYVGEGNNSAAALMLGLSNYAGCDLTVLTPPGYGLNADLVNFASRKAAINGSKIRQTDQLDSVPDNVDFIYTTRWQTTGTSKSDPSWKEIFRPYYVDASFMKRWPNAVLMHDLPAHRGEEISSDVLDGSMSLAWTQAEMKMASAMAILEYFAATEA